MRFERRGFRSRDRGFRDDEPKPVKPGEEYDVEITEVGAKGDGIARISNFVVFIPDVKKGDKVKIKINDVRNRFATGEKVGASQPKEEAAEAPAEEAAKAPVKEVAAEVEGEEAEEDIEEEDTEEEAEE
jgi:predicted RNA-binding protein with TRAM domain